MRHCVLHLLVLLALVAGCTACGAELPCNRKGGPCREDRHCCSFTCQRIPVPEHMYGSGVYTNICE
ncbi:hypothetical protein BOX15_Mlig014727g3 [Macrostomum lignano]|uniref:WAP domain-containing protein n=1 Tax=Macrostomum lignano TaxID=282301 RepID=A0A267DWP5_9PLAT|nr:hypothetical protein BOX15_Mlig014727g3 [Macrostomum lignano]